MINEEQDKQQEREDSDHYLIAGMNMEHKKDNRNCERR